MPTLSLAMIVKNETGCLAHCLESVRPMVDELVVVDTGSTDGTPELAQSLGAQVYPFAWNQHFAEARNESLRHCTTDWVLVLDADEAIDAEDHARLRAALETEAWSAYRLVSRNYTHQRDQMIFDQVAVPNPGTYREGASFPFYIDQPNLRLFRRLPGVAYRGRIHEMVDPWFQAQGLPIGDLPVVAHHFGKADAVQETTKKAKYLDLAILDAQDWPRDPQRQFNLLQQAYHAGSWALAVEVGQRCLALLGQRPPSVTVILGIALQQLDRHTEACALLGEALATQPEHVAAAAAMATSRMALGQGSQARSLLRRALTHHPGFLPAVLALAELEEQEGHPEAARTMLREALAFHPADENLHLRLIQLSLRRNLLPQAALDAVEALKVLPKAGEGHWHALAVEVLSALNQPAQASRFLLAGLEHFPNHPTLLALTTRIPGFRKP